ncbi:MAG: DUF2271 domain-containing protein [Chitinophagaceae bacterium]|nr:DUF2271 domain-containing protein [Chitinophagaceae bacterium]
MSTGFAQKAATTKYKVMVQMANYTGEGAYVVLSLIDSKGAYEKTLYVMGPDKQWYNTLKEWNKFQAKKPIELSGITGASVTGGDRGICVIEIDNAKIDKGYKLRFETAVEDKEYYQKDAEVPLTSERLSGKTEGKGYIRYVRISAN